MNVTIGIDPIPCPRPRIAVRGKFANAYYPASYKDWKERAKGLIEEAFAGREVSGAVDLDLHVRVRKPKTSKLTHPKPDVDNYAKAVMDALTASGVWADDSQVVSLFVTKSWADEGSIEIDLRKEGR